MNQNTNNLVEAILTKVKQQFLPTNRNIKIVVGMSGGVDSSVAAYLLKLQGYSVVGVFMKNWDEDDGTEYCTAQQDLADARAVANAIGIELHTINFSAEYWDEVFEDFLFEYNAGRTPNPDILCNKEIKFKAFLNYAVEDLEANFIATGHYCRLNYDQNNIPQLLKAVDSNKDQTYFLYAMNQKILNKVKFPVGELTKPEVRLIAEHLNLKTAKKKDSTGICFIGERKFSEFLSNYVTSKQGEIRNFDTQEILGKHDGIMFYTIGQRKGLGIGGIKGHQDQGWYVVAKDVERNIIYVVDKPNHPELYKSRMLVKKLNSLYFASYNPGNPNLINTTITNLTCKVRYRSHDVKCAVTYLDSDTLEVKFDEPQIAITPGQSAVFYNGEICVGGGIIDSSFN